MRSMLAFISYRVGSCIGAPAPRDDPRLVSQLRRWHVGEAAEVGEIVELGDTGRLGMIATERDIEGIAGGRREGQWVHQIVGRSGNDALDRHADVGIGARSEDERALR